MSDSRVKVFYVSDLQAVEAWSLEGDEDINLYFSPDPDDMGFTSVTVEGLSRESVIEYVRAHWGDEDGDWFRDYVVGRVTESVEVI